MDTEPSGALMESASPRITPTSRGSLRNETGGSHALDKEDGSLRALKWSPAGTSPQSHALIRALLAHSLASCGFHP